MPSITPLAAKTPSKAATLTRLRNAARILFVERGYHATRPQDIARQAGVANGTFYLHFADKQQAFLDFAEQAQRELLADLEQSVHGGSRRERWQNVCGAIIDFGVRHPGLLQAAFTDPVFIAPSDDRAWRLYDRIGERMARAIRGEGVSEDYDLEMLSHGLCGLLRHAMIYAGRRGIDRDKLIYDLGRFIDRGLG